MATISTITSKVDPIATLALGNASGALVGNFTFAGSASYATNGDGLDIKTLEGLPYEPSWVDIRAVQATATRAYDVVWDATAKKMVVYDAGTTTQVANTTNLSTVTFACAYIAKLQSA